MTGRSSAGASRRIPPPDLLARGVLRAEGLQSAGRALALGEFPAAAGPGPETALNKTPESGMDAARSGLNVRLFSQGFNI